MKNKKQKKQKVWHKREKDPQKNNHATPKATFDFYNSLYRFTLDAAASRENTKCKKFISAKQDALKTEWIKFAPKGSRIFLNPPYIYNEQFLARVIDQVKKYDYLVGVLIAPRTDSKWWHKYVVPNAMLIRCIKGRVKFVGEEAGAGFPSVLVVFNKYFLGKGKATMISDVLTPAERGFIKQKKRKVMPRKSEAKKEKKKAAKGKKGGKKKAY